LPVENVGTIVLYLKLSLLLLNKIDKLPTDTTSLLNDAFTLAAYYKLIDYSKAIYISIKI